MMAPRLTTLVLLVLIVDGLVWKSLPARSSPSRAPTLSST